ncbi:hypothetical protein KFU94_49770 [Chloroflexi bacterium TSY]|nr:hypothetical protein [Chloroflexi bacterium TSY]
MDRLAFVSATNQLKNETIWAFDEVMEAQENNISQWGLQPTRSTTEASVGRLHRLQNWK